MGSGTGWLGQDVVGELDNARTERLARFIIIRIAEIRSVFFAYDRIIREGLREYSVDNSLCRIVRHFILFYFSKGKGKALAPSTRVTSDRPSWSVVSWRTSYGAVVALDKRLSCDDLVENRCG
jgi:hypothetical protein